jgi:hypothetical protein
VGEENRVTRGRVARCRVEVELRVNGEVSEAVMMVMHSSFSCQAGCRFSVDQNTVLF